MLGFRRLLALLALTVWAIPCSGANLKLDPSFAQLAPDSSIQHMKAHMDDPRIEPWQRDIMRQIVQAHEEFEQGTANPKIPQIEKPREFLPQGAKMNIIQPAPLGYAYGVYDPVADRVVVASGTSIQVLSLGDLPAWEGFDLSGTTHSVSPRSVAVYDVLRSRMLVFGGGYDGTLSNEVWSLSLSGIQAWTQISPAGPAPSPRYGQCAIYDPLRDRIITFGGFDGTRYVGDTWALSLSGTPQWTQLTPAMSPPRRSGAACAYDALRDRFIIASGVDSTGNNVLGDTWVLPLTSPDNWISLNPGGAFQPRCDYGAGAYDAPRDQLVLFANDGFGSASTSWALPLSGGGAWQQLNPVDVPQNRRDAAFCYDSNRHQLILSAGNGIDGQYNSVYWSDTWLLALDGAPEWSTIAACQATIVPTAAWNSQPSLPEPLYGSTATYDPLRNRALVFGGVDGSGNATNHLWQLTLGANPQWSAISASGSPPSPRYGHGAAYDATRDRLLIFGGYGAPSSFPYGAFLSDVWALTLSGSQAWTQVQPTGTAHPAGRIWTQAVYDPLRDRLLVFGGDSTYIETYTCCADCYPHCCGSYQVREDELDQSVWALNLGGSPAWSTIESSTGPPHGRWGHGLIYDPLGDRLVLHGGIFEDQTHSGYYCPIHYFYFDAGLTDTWTFNLSGVPGWRQIATTGCIPAARLYGTLIADPLRNEVLLAGGTPAHTMWGLSLDDNASWVQLTPDNPSATGRSKGFGLLDAAGGRVLFLGGQSVTGGATPTDAWALSLPSTSDLHITTGAILPSASMNISYSATLSAAGGVPPYTWRANLSTLPSGFTLTAGGVLSGTSSVVANYTFLVGVADSRGTLATRAFSLLSYQRPTISAPTPLPSGIAQQPYAFTLSATGGRPPFAWTVMSGQLPHGLTLDPSGLLHGTTSDTGTYGFVAQVSDSASTTDSKALTASFGLVPLRVTSPTALPQAVKGHSYQTIVLAVGGLAPRAWSVLSGSLPSGLSLSSSGTLGGVPTQRQLAIFQVQATDAGGNTANQACSLRVDLAPVQITSGGSAAFPLDHPFSVAMTATGGAPPYTWFLASGAPPPGVNLSADGSIGGTATTTGAYGFVVGVRDTESTSAQQNVTITVGTTLRITTTSPLTSAHLNTAFTQLLQARGGTGVYVWSLISGSLPTGLSLSAQGIISGTPSVVGSSSAVAKVMDGAGDSASLAFTLNVSNSIYISTQFLPGASIAHAYSYQLAAGGATPPVSWFLLSGGLPAGLNLQSDGLLTGTPLVPGNYGFSVRASQTDGATAVGSFTMDVLGGNFSIATADLPQAYAGEFYLDSLQVAGGTQPVTWNVVTGASPQGVQLSTSGVLSGIPAGAGDFPMTIRATDNLLTQATASFVLHLTPALTVAAFPALPAAFTGANYLASLKATGGVPPYSWTLSSGALPAGVQLQLDGTVQGNCSAAGSYNFTTQVYDSRGSASSGQWNLSVRDPNPLFVRISGPTPGGGASALAAADLDGDGKLDLVTPNFGSGDGSTLTLLRGQPGGNFGGRGDYAAGSGPRALTAADLDGVAGPELAVADWSSGNVSVLSMVGGIPIVQSSFFSGFYPSDVALADLDGDGFPEIVASNFGSSSAVVFFNQGDGTFQLGPSLRTGAGPMRLVLADADGDGIVDVLTANPGVGTISFLKSRGDGTFLRKRDLVTGVAPRALAVLDANRDGIPDLEVADSASGVVRLLRGLGSGSFATPVSIPVGLGPVDILAADLDGDGIADLLVANFGDNTVSMLRGRGDGTFAERADSPTGSGPISLAIGDFNADSRPDVAVLCAGSNTISVLLNTGASLVTPVAVSDLEADWAATGSVLHWKFFGTGGTAIRVQRAGLDRKYTDVSGDLLADPGAAMTFVDASAAAGNSYIYRLAWQERGAVRSSNEVRLTPRRQTFALGEPVPNPTRGSVSFRFALPARAVVRMEILDISGRRVRTVLDAVHPAGQGTATWDGRGLDGTSLPAGIYFARLESSGQVMRRRMVLLR